jgi:hypothetical protein
VRPDDAVGDVRRGALAERPAERLADGELRVERDTRDALAVVRVRGDRARGVAAVAVVVGAGALLDRAAEDRQDALGLRAERDLAGEVLMGRADAGVDDADERAARVRERPEAGRVPALRRVDVSVRRAAGLARVLDRRGSYALDFGA